MEKSFRKSSPSRSLTDSAMTIMDSIANNASRGVVVVITTRSAFFADIEWWQVLLLTRRYDTSFN